MRKKNFGIVVALFLLAILGAFNFLLGPFNTKPKTIGILIPVEHVSLQEIVSGFQKKIKEHFKTPIIFNVQSAQGDIKLQRSITELFIGQQVDMIVPVGTSTTQMALSLVKEQPIVSLAALYPETERQKRTIKNITGVLDEIGGQKKLDFIKEVFPGLNGVTLVFHGGNEKTFSEVEEIVQYGKQIGITIRPVMIQNLIDLHSVSRNITKDAQAILILKDSLIASGIRTLVAVAKKHHIPLITGDEGTVLEGAALALGVRESKIGEEGALLAIKVLEGQPIADLPIQEIQEISLFYNPERCKMLGIDLAKLQKYAQKKQYALTAVEGLK